MIENKHTEFKREFVDDLKKTVIAFANTSGGNIYIGIADNGEVIGVSDVDETMLRVTNTMRDVIKPDITMFMDCSCEVLENKNVVKITVQSGTAKPYYLAKKGIRPEGVFVRQGASSVPATESAILKMIRETSGECFEEARSINQNLHFTQIDNVFKEKNIAFTETQKRTLGLIGEDNTFTNLGLILSDDCPYTIKIAVFEGTIKSIFKDRYEFTGSMLKQLEAAYNYIDRYNRTKAEFHGLNRIDTRDYPIEAIREALLNAVVHRDYAFSTSILINIFDDRIEFVSVGGLVKGISYNDIMLGISITRNKKLANIFYRLRLIEAYGTGIMKINSSYADCIAKPHIEVSDNAFKITLPNTNHQAESNISNINNAQDTSVDNNVKKVLALIDKKQTIVRKDIQDELGISQATAILLLSKMQKDKLIIKIGAGRKTRYTRP